MKTNNIQSSIFFGRKCQKHKSQGFDDRNLKNKENLKYFEYKMQIFETDFSGCLSVVLDYPNAKGKQSLPLCNVVHPLGD